MPELKLHDRVISEILVQRAQKEPDRPFLTIAGDTWTYKRFYEEAAGVAAGLRSLGVERGRRVVMMLPNRIEFLLGWFGTALAGATIVPLNPEWKGETLSYILTDAQPSIAIIQEDLMEQVGSTLASSRAFRQLWSVMPRIVAFRICPSRSTSGKTSPN